MTSYDSFFHQRLIEKISEIKVAHFEMLATQLPLERYHAECGFIRALDNIVALCEDVRKEMNNPR